VRLPRGVIWPWIGVQTYEEAVPALPRRNPPMFLRYGLPYREGSQPVMGSSRLSHIAYMIQLMRDSGLSFQVKCIHSFQVVQKPERGLPVMKTGMRKGPTRDEIVPALSRELCQERPALLMHYLRHTGLSFGV
jgi:hypothetical protein